MNNLDEVDRINAQLKFIELSDTTVKSGFIQGLKVIKGIMFAAMSRSTLNKLAEEKKQFKPRKDDVIMIGYPKSGTTWTSEIIWLLQNNLDYQKQKDVNHMHRILRYELGAASSSFVNKSSPRFIRTHLPIDFFADDLPQRCKVFIFLF